MPVLCDESIGRIRWMKLDNYLIEVFFATCAQAGSKS